MTAEQTTWLTVYQPLIIGFGAVVLGFLANGLLEWWKEYLRDSRLKLRFKKFIYADLDFYIIVLKIGLGNIDLSKDRQGFYLQKKIRDLDEHFEDFGLLEFGQVQAIVKAFNSIIVFRQYAEKREYENRHDHIWFYVEKSELSDFKNILEMAIENIETGRDSLGLS